MSVEQMNRLEEAVDTGQANRQRYQYNGLGHRVGKRRVSFQRKTGEAGPAEESAWRSGTATGSIPWI